MRVYFLLLGVLIVCACAGEQRDVKTVATEKPQPEPFVLPAIIPAPSLPDEVWQMPAIGLRSPDFPYLPGEGYEDGSRSVGTVTEGYLIDATQIPTDNPRLKFLEVQAQRRLFFTSTEMRTLVEKASDYVEEVLPGTPIYLGNFGALGGGDIPYSVSHNSGRDADIAFHTLAPSGNVWVPKSFIEFAENGTWTDPTTQGVYRFDVPRNWAVIEGLLAHHKGQLQAIFVSNGLRRLLLDHAARMGVRASVRQEASMLLAQPSGSLPHNDHFHIRLFCSARDVSAGCQDTGRKTASFKGHADSLRTAVQAASEALKAEDPLAQRNGALRLALLGDASQVSVLTDLLKAPEASVRAAAVRALSELQKGAREIGEHLAVEEDPHVRLEILASLANYRLPATQDVLLTMVREGKVHSVGDWVVDERAVAAGALMYLEDGSPVKSLVATLPVIDENAQREVMYALGFLTNQSWTDVAQWQDWYDTHAKKTRDEWLVTGFRETGYEVKDLTKNSVWELCRAVSGPDHISVNAQRVLMRLSKTDVPSTTWSKYDASFHWRRWFERRTKQLGLAPIPAELSTVGGYVRQEAR